MAAKTVLSMEESMCLVEWGRKNTEYMTRNPRNNIRRKIKTDTGIDAGLTKIVELEKMFKIVKKHGGKRPAGNTYTRLLADLQVVAEAVRNIGRMHNLTWDADGAQRTHTAESRRWLEEARKDAVKSFIRVDDMLQTMEKMLAKINGEEAAEKTG